MRLSRATGAGVGAAIVVLALWAGIIPFVGPYFGYGFSPDATWHFTLDRLWLDILPAVAALIAGVMISFSRRRGSGLIWSALAVTAGLWLLVGSALSMIWHHPAPGVVLSGIGAPLGGHDRAALELIGFFYGVGALITMLGAFAAGRFAPGPRLEPVITTTTGTGIEADHREVTASRLRGEPTGEPTAITRPRERV